MSKARLFEENKDLIQSLINDKQPISWILKKLNCSRTTFKKHYPDYNGNENLSGFRVKKVKKYTPGNCKQCGKEHDGTFGSGVFCSRNCSNKRSIESRLKASISISKTANSKEKHCWNHGLDSRVQTLCPICNKYFKKYRSSKKILCSRICKEKDINYLYRKEPARKGGGYRENSGRGKRGRYRGLFFQSTWELAYIVYCLDKNVSIKRNTQKFDYTFDGKIKKYIPDFIVDDKYVEIKGYFTSEVEAKIHNFPSIIEIIGPKEIIPYIEYAKEKGGNNFYDTLKDK